jgi:hypothetical protein
LADRITIFPGDADIPAGVFYGIELTDNTENLPALNLDPATNFVGFDATRFSVSGDTLRVDFAGLDVSNLSTSGAARVVFDANPSVANIPIPEPEPVSIAVFGASLAAVVLRRRRAKLGSTAPARPASGSDQ